MARPFGSTRSGIGAWLVQRVTSLYMAGFVLYLAIRFMRHPIVDYAQWKLWWSSVALRLAVSLFLVSTLAHAWVGLRSVWMDYLKPFALRFTVSALTAVLLSLLALWMLRSLLIL